jgi:hypothetical protein
MQDWPLFAPFNVTSNLTTVTVKMIRSITVMQNGEEITETALETMANLSTLTTSLPTLTWSTLGTTL